MSVPTNAMLWALVYYNVGFDDTVSKVSFHTVLFSCILYQKVNSVFYFFMYSLKCHFELVAG